MPMVIFLANFLLFRIRVTAGADHRLRSDARGRRRHRLERQPRAPDRARAQPRRRADAARRLLLWRLHGGAALQAGPALAIDDHGDGGLGLPDLPALLRLRGGARDSRHLARHHRLAGRGIFTAIFPSLVAQVLFIKGNEIIGSNRAGIFINLVPIFGTLL
jgi:hypothetical protein